MNESMNFGNIGFNSVASNNTENNFEVKAPTTTTGQNITEENSGIDFPKSSVAKIDESKEDNFSSIEFGPLQKYLDDDDITDISYSNGGQLWLKSLQRGVYRADQQDVDNALVEKIAFQCSNIMGKTFNMAHPFLDSESAELRMNFVHDSIARNGIAAVFRKTPAKIRLEKSKLLNEKDREKPIFTLYRNENPNIIVSVYPSIEADIYKDDVFLSYYFDIKNIQTNYEKIYAHNGMMISYLLDDEIRTKQVLHGMEQQFIVDEKLEIDKLKEETEELGEQE